MTEKPWEYGEIDAEKFTKDVRHGLSENYLMAKYDLNPKEFGNLIQILVREELLLPNEVSSFVTIFRKPFGKTPVILTIALAIVTAGIYVPIWYWSRQERLNALKSSSRLRTWAIITLLVSIIVANPILSPAYEALGKSVAASALSQEAKTWFLVMVVIIGLIARIVSIVFWIWLAFVVARIIDGSSSLSGDRYVVINNVAVWFLTIFYLQYKMNRMAAPEVSVT